MEIPNKIKHYDFKKIIIESMGIDYENFLESTRVREIHTEFLKKYSFNNLINWHF